MIVTILGVLIIVLMAIFIGWIYYYLQVNSPKKSKLKKEEKIQEEIRHCVDCVHWIEGAVLGSYYPNSKFEHSKCGRPRQRDLKEISALELVGMPDPVNIPINETCARCRNTRRKNNRHKAVVHIDTGNAITCK